MCVASYRRWWRETHPDIPYGYCLCGCGKPSPISTRTDEKRDHYIGEPRKYVRGHNGRKLRVARICENCGETFLVKPHRRKQRFCNPSCINTTRSGEAHPRWKGGYVNKMRYSIIRVGGKYVYEHRAIAERMLGRALTTDEQVHHINGDKLDNSPENLVVLPNSEHQRLHALLRRQAPICPTFNSPSAK